VTVSFPAQSCVWPRQNTAGGAFHVSAALLTACWTAAG
jgi:hypothetical protein